MNQYHRVIKIPAAQVKVGDVVLWNNRDNSFFDGHSQPERLRVMHVDLDHSDGTIYVKCGEGKAQYLEPFEHVRLDCLETFGFNYGQ